MFKFSFKTDRLLKWAKYFEELPRKTSSAIVKALNTAGDAVVREMVRKISRSTGFSQAKVRKYIKVTKATESKKSYRIKQEVLPPSLDWSRPWQKPKSVTDPDEMVKIITMEDDNVCPICRDAAEHNPYKMSDIRRMLSKWEHTTHPGLLHPNCRCTIGAWSNMRRLAVQFSGKNVPEALTTVRQVGKKIADAVRIVIRAKK